jgi:hypothetical protein
MVCGIRNKRAKNARYSSSQGIDGFLQMPETLAK